MKIKSSHVLATAHNITIIIIIYLFILYYVYAVWARSSKLGPFSRGLVMVYIYGRTVYSCTFSRRRPSSQNVEYAFTKYYLHRLRIFFLILDFEIITILNSEKSTLILLRLNVIKNAVFVRGGDGGITYKTKRANGLF